MGVVRVQDLATAPAPLDGTEVVEIEQGGVSYKTTAQDIADLGGGLSNPMTTAEDLIVGGASGVPARLPVGTDGQVLTVTTGSVGWATPGGLSNPMTTSGDIITGGASGAPQRLAAGADGHVLTLVSGAPAWAAASGGGGVAVPQWEATLTADPYLSSFSRLGFQSPLVTGIGGGGVFSASDARRIPYRTATATASATAIAGWRQNDAAIYFCRNAGFYLAHSGGPSTGATIASHRLFLGFRAATGVPTDVEPSTLVDFFALAYDSADTNVQIMHNDGSGAATKIDLGSSFPKPTTTNSAHYVVEFSCSPGASSIDYRVTEVISSATASGVISTNIPASSTALGWYQWMSAGGTSTGIELRTSSVVARV